MRTILESQRACIDFKGKFVKLVREGRLHLVAKLSMQFTNFYVEVYF